MTKSRPVRVTSLGLLFLAVLSPLFLMGDFCDDVASLPIEFDYTTPDCLDQPDGDSGEITIKDDCNSWAWELPFDQLRDLANLPELPDEYQLPDGDTDLDLPDLDLEESAFELPSGKVINCYQKNGNAYCPLPSQTQSVSFLDGSLGKSVSKTLKKYKDNIHGIYINNVSFNFSMIGGQVPIYLPPVEISLGDSIPGLDGDADSEADISESELKTGLMQLGTIVWNTPLSLKDSDGFQPIFIKTENIGQISEILGKLAFRINIESAKEYHELPAGGQAVKPGMIVFDDELLNQVKSLPDSKIVIRLRFSIVIVVGT